jgi:hypothetical protein
LRANNQIRRFRDNAGLIASAQGAMISFICLKERIKPPLLFGIHTRSRGCGR